MYYNLSKNSHFVNGKILSRFVSAKLKNKSSIAIGSELYFFIFSKQLLIKYIKARLENLNEKKHKNINITQEESYTKNLQQNCIKELAQSKNNQNNLKVKKKKVTKKEEYTSDNSEENIDKTRKYKNIITSNFENILKPPGRTNLKSGENENILDDIIEAPIKKSNFK
jgi:hypothetical protein